VSIAGRHAEIGRRYRNGERTPVTIPTLRVAELRRLFYARYGLTLPDDDAGREDAFIMTAHLVHGQEAERRIAAWLSLWCPWMGAAETEKLTAKVIAKRYRWTPDKLAFRLRLTEAERHRLRITTIGAIDLTKDERLARRRHRARHRDELRRRRKGSKPRADYEANSISRNKPWERLGMSRAKWYRAGKPAPT
jgi:hypothetical protein